MTQMFAIHPDNPQARLLRQAAACIESGGLVVYPTDSGYAMGCKMGHTPTLERMRSIRQLDKTHYMTLVCRDLSSIGAYARMTKPTFRLLKAFTPGSYTFILSASPNIPRLMQHPKRKTSGVRVPAHHLCLSLLECLDEPLMSTSLLLPGASSPLSEPESIRDVLGKHVDLIIDGGVCSYQPTTVVDLTGEYPAVLRHGRGDPVPFQ